MGSIVNIAHLRPKFPATYTTVIKKDVRVNVFRSFKFLDDVDIERYIDNLLSDGCRVKESFRPLYRRQVLHAVKTEILSQRIRVIHLLNARFHGKWNLFPSVFASCFKRHGLILSCSFMYPTPHCPKKCFKQSASAWRWRENCNYGRVMLMAWFSMYLFTKLRKVRVSFGGGLWWMAFLVLVHSGNSI